jgi:hypothetical protein
MLMHEKETMKAYMSYVESDLTRSLFLRERVQKGFKIKTPEFSFTTKRYLPIELLNDLVEHKQAVCEPFERISYEGSEKVFGLTDAKARTTVIDGDRYIQIRILADNIHNLMQKIDVIRKEMEKYNIKDKICYWSQIGDIDSKANETKTTKATKATKKQTVKSNDTEQTSLLFNI